MKSIREAEQLLRIALFSDDLPLTISENDVDSLPEQRKELAELLRVCRKKGVIPVFVSMGWFVVALAISIQGSFAHLGSNAAAHDLALGLLLAWLPIMVLSSITDRNPIGTDMIRLELNRLLDHTRDALLDHDRRSTYAGRIGKLTEDFEWMEALRNENFLESGFFSRFAGQGRVRWHVRPTQLALFFF